MMASLDTKCPLFIFMSLRDTIFFFSYCKSAYYQFFTNKIFYLLQILLFLTFQLDRHLMDKTYSFSIFTCPSSRYCTSNISQTKYFCYFMIFFSYNDLKLVFFLIFFYLSLSLLPSFFFFFHKGVLLF